MKPAKILIIDKDILARRALANILKDNSNYKIAGACRKTEDAIKEVSDTDPELVLLNIEEDNFGKQSIFRNLREQFPSLPIIVLSSRKPAGARQVIQALRMGAADFITKPDQKKLLFARNHLKKRLIPAIDAVIAAHSVKNFSPDNTDLIDMAQASFKQFCLKKNEMSTTELFDLVVIGGGSGGPKALFTLISSLPSDFPVPVIIAQHAPKFYTAELAQRLNETTDLTVREAIDGAELKAGSVWVAPGGFHNEIQRLRNKSVLQLHRGPRVKGMRPSIDVLLCSASKLFGRRVLAVVLNGCGKDGLEGMKAVRASGGRIIANHSPHPGYSMPLYRAGDSLFAPVVSE